MTPEDLRAAVAAGILSEAQAASLQALANDRSGRRSSLPSEDEPFEFFRGFSEIFISIGLIILLTGVAGLLAAFDHAPVSRPCAHQRDRSCRPSRAAPRSADDAPARWPLADAHRNE